MIPYQYKKPKLLFVGINPHPGSDSRGVPFSNNKTFWYLLSDAGLLPEPRADLRADDSLREMYRTRFNTMYNLGFVNLIDRPTVDVSLLRKGEERAGKERLLRIIKEEKPKVVCFVGKISYATYSGLKEIAFGWTGDIFEARAYVMHFPLRGAASVRVEELRELAEAAALFQK